MPDDRTGGFVPRVRAWDAALLDRLPDPAGAARLAVLAVTALGSAVVTVPLEAWGYAAGAPGLRPWFLLALLADVPGHLLVIVPLRYATRRPRPRPFARAPFLLDDWNRYSFPSAHSLRVCTLATLATLAAPASGFFFALAAVLIAGSRLVLRRHWPSDILVGGLLGVLWALLARALAPALGVPLP